MKIALLLLSALFVSLQHKPVHSLRSQDVERIAQEIYTAGMKDCVSREIVCRKFAEYDSHYNCPSDFYCRNRIWDLNNDILNFAKELEQQEQKFPTDPE